MLIVIVKTKLTKGQINRNDLGQDLLPLGYSNL